MEKLFNLLWADIPVEERSFIIKFMWRLTVLAYIGWTLGLFSIFGIPGFVKAEDMKQAQENISILTTQVVNIRSSQLEDSILRHWTNFCSTSEDTLKSYYYKQYSIDQGEYFNIKNRRFEVPPCKGP
jgi:hypothetical protein